MNVKFAEIVKYVIKKKIFVVFEIKKPFQIIFFYNYIIFFKNLNNINLILYINLVIKIKINYF